MFNFLNKKAIKFSQTWDKKNPSDLSGQEKVLYTIAMRLKKLRKIDPSVINISEEDRKKIRESFYHKYFNLIGSQKTAQNLINEQKKPIEQRKERSMPLPFKISKTTLAFAGAAVVVIALAIGVYFTRGPAGNSGGALAANLSVADGQVEIWNGSEWRAAPVDEILASQSQLRTGENSKAVLEFDEGSALRLDENTHVILEEINNKNISILQIAGETYNRINKTSGLTYKVKSGDTETTALGTAFDVSTEKSNWVKNGEKKVIVKVVESKVKVKIIKNEETLEKEVSEGEELIVDLTKPIEDVAKKIPLAKEETAQDGFYVWNRTEDAKKDYPLGILSDVTGPDITIVEPLDGIDTELTRVAVKGKTEPGATVLVNGIEVENKAGTFEKIINLKVGDNSVEVKAKDDSGNATKKIITVTRKGMAQILPLYLKGYASTDGVHLSWTLSDVDAPNGFKLIKSLDAYPTYPGDSAVYIDKGTRNYVWKILDGKVYHFRICIYKDGSCGIYSNDLKITTKTANESQDIYGTISLNATYLGDYKIKLSWSLKGNAPYGFKLVKSLEPSPVYPGNDYVYLSDPNVRSYVWDMAYPGTYHFRICAYNGNGACVFYSNDKSLPVQ